MTHYWQSTLELPRYERGIHLITREIVAAVPQIARVRVGLLHIFIQHTSASLAINENADSDVRADLADALDRLVPERGIAYRHDEEGPDDMPAHVKAVLCGSSLTVPVTDGRLALGRWQGVYLCEHRSGVHRRSLVLTLSGAGADLD